MRNTRMFIVSALILAASAFATTAQADGGWKMRFIEGYDSGYEHGFEDGYMRAHFHEMEEAHHHLHCLPMAMEEEGDHHYMKEHRGCACEHRGYSSKRSFERFSERLDLSKEQQDKIRPILNEEVKTVAEFYKQAHEKELQQIEETRKKVNAVLKPEQQKKFNTMIDKGIEKFKKMMKHMEVEEKGESPAK